MIENDFRLKLTKNNHYDIEMKDYDFVNVTDLEAVRNGVITSILTHYNELSDYLPNYEDFGSHLQELIKDNKTRLTPLIIKEYIRESLDSMKNIITIENIDIEDQTYDYKVKLVISYKNRELNMNFNVKVA